jgi:hypothetical protein
MPPLADRTRVWLARTWFAVAPATALVVAAFARDRACADPYALLPAVAARPLAAYAVAAAYVAGHVWLAAAWLTTIAGAGRVVPRPADVRRVWTTQAYMPAALLAIVLLEQMPIGVWRLLARRLGLC